MILGLLGTALIFFVMSLGLAWSAAGSLRLDPAEKVAASAALSILGSFLIGWIVYICSLPTASLWVIPVLTAVSLFAGRRTLIETLRNPTARQLLVGQALVTGWCICWLALIISYGGGKWVGDWFGHWQRANFFLYHWPQDLLFNRFDPMPSRPPLANVVLASYMRLSQHGFGYARHDSFAHYQLASTVLGSLAFLPAALLARRFCKGARGTANLSQVPAMAVLTLLFLLNPLVVQNATFAWTKLPAAFFTLLSIYFFCRSRDADAPASAPALMGATLGAALITHYSAGPYAVLLVLAWFVLGRQNFRTAHWQRSTAAAALSGGVVLVAWFGWALAIYGVRGTFLSNTTVTDQAGTWGEQWHVIALNLRDTLVPPFFRLSVMDEFAQSSPWGWWRDLFFLTYQNNLIFAFGSTGLAAIVAALWRPFRHWSWFWIPVTVALIILGVGTHGGRESSGLAHISLQPLVLLGLAFLAGRWASLSLAWRRILVAGTTVDFALGIALQTGVSNLQFDRWFTPGRPLSEMAKSYSRYTQINSRIKEDVGWVFFGDYFTSAYPLLIALLVALFLLALTRAKPTQPT